MSFTIKKKEATKQLIKVRRYMRSSSSTQLEVLYPKQTDVNKHPLKLNKTKT